MVGQLLSLEEKEDCFLAKIAYPVETSGLEVTQFLNVVFGNSSLQPHIWVVDIEFSPSLLDVFTGPKFGLAGIRELCQTPTRPMIQAVIKPMGTPNEELARMCHAYTMGGADVIKDDHGLTNQSFSPSKIVCHDVPMQYRRRMLKVVITPSMQPMYLGMEQTC